MELIKSVVKRRRKFVQARSLPSYRASLLVPGYEFSHSKRWTGTEARKCFPSIVASAGENSLWAFHYEAERWILFYCRSNLLYCAREGTTFYCKSALLYCESPGIAILHGQRKMIFENRALPPWVLTSGFHCGETPTRRFLSKSLSAH